MRNFLSIAIFTYVFVSSPRCHASLESLTKNTSISAEDHGKLVSQGKIFQLGFFRTASSTYLGIWYYMDPKTIVWVGNRDNPLSSTSSAILTIEDDGNLVVEDKSKRYFITGLPSSSGSRTLKLLDTGNLILSDESGTSVWSSFNFPTDTFLPGMYMENTTKLTSWKSDPDDPATGNFIFQKDQIFGYNNYTIFSGNKLQWKSGFELGSNINPTKMTIAALNMLSRSNSSKTLLTYSRMVMNSSGEIQLYYWDLAVRRWVLNWSEPKDYCSIYNTCGPNSSCNISKSHSFCNCLPGFELGFDDSTPNNACKRMSTVCSGNDTSFYNIKILSIDVSFQTFLESRSEAECKEKCLGLDCCQAYLYIGVQNQELVLAGIPGGKQGCWIWSSGSQLVDTQTSGDEGSGHIFSIRNRLSSEGTKNPRIVNGNGKRSKPITPQVIIPSAIAIAGAMFFCCIGFLCYKRRINIKNVKESDSVHLFHENVRQVHGLLDRIYSDENDSPGIGIHFFDFECISASTDGFSDANKLGEGGFGPVYKGKLLGGLEVAVKRLSIHSGQGLEEFKNEVTLIAKLQHRNLVRLLGYCMKGNEKMLIYEYMPNKSLDVFIFDGAQSSLLDWTKRFKIIMGICRGLIYLHQDSRLRIIHRDLKTSNVLLDEELNPKISDFGLAKIVNGKEVESNTKRIVGTYGYMAPEYALEGLVSIKSDVYSFGVVILEIVSGKKKHYQCDQAISLLNYAWQLWKEGRPLDIMEQVLLGSYDPNEVLKCIIVGLLCVQEDPNDRPNMSNVVTMLTSDISTLPEPKKPAFVVRNLTTCYEPSSSSAQARRQTNAEVTISTMQGR